MLRELKEYTAECDVPDAGDDCHEIVQVQAPDEENAMMVLSGKGWHVERRSAPGVDHNETWVWVACPHCALALN